MYQALKKCWAQLDFSSQIGCGCRALGKRSRCQRKYIQGNFGVSCWNRKHNLEFRFYEQSNQHVGERPACTNLSKAKGYVQLHRISDGHAARPLLTTSPERLNDLQTSPIRWNKGKRSRTCSLEAMHLRTQVRSYQLSLQEEVDKVIKAEAMPTKQQWSSRIHQVFAVNERIDPLLDIAREAFEKISQGKSLLLSWLTLHSSRSPEIDIKRVG